jgi:hypothetical protein
MGVNGQVFEKLLKMRHFRLLLDPDEPELAPPGPPEAFGIGRVCVSIDTVDVESMLPIMAKRRSWVSITERPEG